MGVLGEHLLGFKLYAQFAPFFRMDGMEERENGYFYYCEDVERTRSESSKGC